MIASNENRRPGLAIIANCITPYRVNLHRLIAAGIPELKLHTLITHDRAEFDWRIEVPDEIHSSYFGAAGDVPIAALYDAPFREWRKGGRLLEYLRQHDIRAVICGLPRYISYLRVVCSCHRADVPVFVNSDANIQSEKSLSPSKKMVKAQFHRWWLKRVTGVMPMGRFGEQYFHKYGVEPSRMYRVPYTPDYDLFASVESQQLESFRREHGLSTSRRYLLFSGRLVRAKRVDLLIDAFIKIAADRPAWDLMIVGDGVLRDELRRRVPISIKPRVHWVGFLDQEMLVSAYHASDVLVLPSDCEPWALVIQEAISAGLAVVASDVVGAARDILEDGVSGRIFSAGNLDSLLAALIDVSDPSRLAAYKEQSQKGLAAWRKNNDPVDEIRRALADFGVLSNACSIQPMNAIGS